jgi:hypothetical protein
MAVELDGGGIVAWTASSSTVCNRPMHVQGLAMAARTAGPAVESSSGHATIDDVQRWRLERRSMMARGDTGPAHDWRRH